MEKDVITESILDPVQKTRCKEVFDLKTELMKKDVKDFILNILEEFKNNTKLNFTYTTVFMIGSSTGFQYTETSDIDINARVSLPRTAFKGKFSLIPKGVILPNTQKPINIFVAFDDDEQYNPDYAENIYNILTDKWDKQSTLEKSEIPYSYVAGLATFFMDGCELMFGKYERDKKELQKYIGFDPKQVAITEKEKDEAINRKITDLQNDADSLKMAHHFMFSFNNEGFSDSPFLVSINYKFKDPHYSMNNLVYKYIDSFGYYERINSIQKEVRELVKQAKEEIKKNTAEGTPEGENKKEIQKEVQTKDLKESKRTQQENEEDDEQYTWSNGTIHHEPEPEKEEIKNILKENGYEPTDKNVKFLLAHLDEDYYIFNSVDDDLEESLKSRTERKLNKVIYKASGKWSEGIFAGLGFLFTGVIGAELMDCLAVSHNKTLDDTESDLYAEVQSDSECKKIISNIKKELNSKKPDKKRLKSLRADFSAAVLACKSKMKADRESWKAKPRISLAERYSDEELKDILYSNGYAKSESNIKLLREGKFILEEKLSDEK